MEDGPSEKLVRLAELRAQGLLSEKEFATAKADTLRPQVRPRRRWMLVSSGALAATLVAAGVYAAAREDCVVVPQSGGVCLEDMGVDPASSEGQQSTEGCVKIPETDAYNCGGRSGSGGGQPAQVNLDAAFRAGQSYGQQMVRTTVVGSAGTVFSGPTADKCQFAARSRYQRSTEAQSMFLQGCLSAF